jgi:F0F1-type ATP synthase assembly protein I
MIWLSLADTTWRVTVPTVLLAGLGIVLDKKLSTMPLWTLVGLVVGLAAAGALVWQQLQAVTKAEDKK